MRKLPDPLTKILFLFGIFIFYNFISKLNTFFNWFLSSFYKNMLKRTENTRKMNSFNTGCILCTYYVFCYICSDSVYCIIILPSCSEQFFSGFLIKYLLGICVYNENDRFFFG